MHGSTGWSKPSSVGMPGKRGLPAAFLTLFRGHLLSPDPGPAAAKRRSPETPSAAVWGQRLSWLPRSLPAGTVSSPVAALLSAHLELGRAVRLPCQIPEALSLLMKHF